MDYMDIAWNIYSNKKRMEKIQSLRGYHRRTEKINNLITAECRENKIKLSKEQREEIYSFIVARVK